MRVAFGVLLGVAWLAPGLASAFPDGAPWDAAHGDGCAACHFDTPTITESEALSLAGLPPAVVPGTSYSVDVVLRAGGMRRAGFLVVAWQGLAPAGTFDALNDRVEAAGGMARSTAAGADLAGAGEARWSLLWRAPTAGRGPIRILVRANAANGDDSPLGDATHEIEVTVRQE